MPGDLLVPLIVCTVANGSSSKRRNTELPPRGAVFLGLVLGDFLMGSVWSILSIVLNVETYQFYP